MDDQPDDADRFEGMTREDLIHDAQISQQQLVLLANGMAEAAEARSKLYRDIAELTAQRDALLRAITAPGTITDRDRVRLAVLGVEV